MKLRTAQDIERVALARGAVAEIGGRTFNSAKDRVIPKAPAPAPAAPPALTHEDVVRIAAEMLAESERRTAQAMVENTQALTAAIAKALKDAAPPAAAPGKRSVLQKVKVAYDQDDRIVEMTPVYKDE